MATASLRRQIGIVPQETWLFAGKLRDNIAYGNRNATDEEIQSAAYAANAYFIEGMEQKFDTIVGERGIRLSGGERQRIAIAPRDSDESAPADPGRSDVPPSTPPRRRWCRRRWTP